MALAFVKLTPKPASTDGISDVETNQPLKCAEDNAGPQKVAEKTGYLLSSWRNKLEGPSWLSQANTWPYYKFPDSDCQAV